MVESEEHIALEAKNKRKPDNVKKSKKKEAAVLVCPSTKNHESKASLKKDGTILKIPAEDKFGVPAAGLQVLTRRTYKDILVNSKVDVQENSDKKLVELAQEISRKLTDEVFSEEGSDRSYEEHPRLRKTCYQSQERNICCESCCDRVQWLVRGCSEDTCQRSGGYS